MQLRISAWLGIAFGVFLVCGETVRNWGAWGYWASYTFDYLFAVMLIFFGRMTLKGARWAHVALIAAWALTVALFSYSFSSHIKSINSPTYGPIPQVELTIFIGVLDAIAITALVLAVYDFVAKRSDAVAKNHA